MADESVKKPEFVLNKKKTDTAAEKPASSGTPGKKRVVIVKKGPPANGVSNRDAQISAVKKVVPSAIPSQKAVESASSGAVHPSPAEHKTLAPEEKKAPSSFEFGSRRPNVKAGNLSDHPRPNDYRGGGFRGPRNNYSNNQGGYNNNYQHRDGGFTGAQAREGYQNRERDSQGAYQGRGGAGGRPPFAQGQGRPGGYRNGTAGSRPGFTGQRPNGNSRPGFTSSRPASHSAPAPMPDVRSAGKKAFKGKKQQVYSRKDREDLFDESSLYDNKKKTETPASVVPKQIDIMETISVSDLAKKMNLKASEIISKLMAMGMMVTITQSIDSDTATLLASEYGCDVHLVSLYDETVIESEKISEEDMLPRPPIVTVMGHVDHGKTKTLDAIRHSNVAAGEFGGITQHIGAYSVSTPKGKITFLDTPGHEAFTMMRARGAQVTDIVVLVVAADDGVMPQTLEAIHHAKDAKVPIIVAVNKIDKPEANPDHVKTQLSEQGLTPEEWGGDTQFVSISALKGQGIDQLLEAVLLQAEVLELKAPVNTRAEGKIIESRVDQGRGIVATVIVQKGTLHQGDSFVAGIYAGRVRAMFNDLGQRIQEAGPSTPVEVLGLEEMPNAGDPFQVTESEKDARSVSSKRQELKRFEDAKAVKKVTLDNLYQTIDASEVKELKVVIKADVQGSAEALKASLEKLSTKDIRLVVIHSSAGAINESDVLLAAADSNAFIIGFNVRPTPKAKLLADQEKVDIRKYNIIYKAVEEVTLAMEGMLKPDTKEEITGTLEVRNTFKVPKIGLIAGCYVTDGLIKRSSMVNLIRDGIVLYTGKVTSLKRFKDDAKEVKTGFECGLGLEDWQDIKVGDQIEAFEYVEVARKLGDTLVDEKADAEKRAVERAAAMKAEAAAALEAEKEQIAAEKTAAKAKKAAAKQETAKHAEAKRENAKTEKEAE
ncbi:translation initiation factor IF-2 [Treponema parvum]|uniref:Translation initiation factor IF-2 n=1 Tax=Treponema parvum TaxID=138851 RepID=A0A975ICL7_9SPIR|nr:translation initiation factor IF-2 [Treponema parvum]QTQ12136.1 translation initiation factor IF-2 [Treponema parvum]